MKDVLVGIFAILVGALFCFRGWLAMRIVIPIWGAFAGFLFGAGLIEAWFGDGFLRTWLSWVVGLVLAMVFFFLAYLYFEVAVILAMMFIGFTLGVSIMSAIGVTWSWVLVLVGLAVGFALGWLAIATNLPMGVLTGAARKMSSMDSGSSARKLQDDLGTPGQPEMRRGRAAGNGDLQGVVAVDEKARGPFGLRIVPNEAIDPPAPDLR